MVKRYLVTGCAGFIAARVAELLLDAGHSVVGIDNLNDAYDPRLKQWRLARLQNLRNFRFHRADITDSAALEPLFQQDADSGRRVGQAKRSPTNEDLAAPVADEKPYSAVINLAARAGVRASVENPRVYYQTNVDGTLNLLDMCRRFGVKKFLLASTSSLYGKDNPVPFREDADTNRPLSPYAASKKAAETLAFTYHYLYGLDVSIPRYFTVYGPAGRPDMSVFRFVRRIAEGEPIVVFGDGSQQRDFTYVDDIARGTIAALRPCGYEVINLGGDRPVRLWAIIDQIAALVGRQPQIERRPPIPPTSPPPGPTSARPASSSAGHRKSRSKKASAARSTGTGKTAKSSSPSTSATRSHPFAPFSLFTPFTPSFLSFRSSGFGTPRPLHTLHTLLPLVPKLRLRNAPPPSHPFLSFRSSGFGTPRPLHTLSSRSEAPASERPAPFTPFPLVPKLRLRNAPPPSHPSHPSHPPRPPLPSCPRRALPNIKPSALLWPNSAPP